MVHTPKRKGEERENEKGNTKIREKTLNQRESGLPEGWFSPPASSASPSSWSEGSSARPRRHSRCCHDPAKHVTVTSVEAG